MLFGGIFAEILFVTLSNLIYKDTSVAREQRRLQLHSDICTFFTLIHEPSLLSHESQMALFQGSPYVSALSKLCRSMNLFCHSLA